jgi:hypothetical protein
MYEHCYRQTGWCDMYRTADGSDRGDAKSDDLGAVSQLLTDAHLPLDGVSDALATVKFRGARPASAGVMERLMVRAEGTAPTTTGSMT